MTGATSHRTRFGLGRLAALALAAAAAGGGCVIRFGDDGPGVRGSGVSATETRPVQGFRRVEINGSTNVVVKAGAAPAVVVTGDDNLLPHVKTSVQGGALIIGMASGSYSTKAPLLVTVTTGAALEGVTIRGSADVEIEGLDTPRFEAHISGSGDLRARGRAAALDASISGSGDMHLFDLSAARAKIRVSGSGDVDVTASEILDAGISGSGDVRYRGRPRVESRVSGSGSVERS